MRWVRSAPIPMLMSSGGYHRRRCYYWYQYHGSKAPPHGFIHAQEGQESDEEEDVEGAPNSCDLVRAPTASTGSTMPTYARAPTASTGSTLAPTLHCNAAAA